MSKASEAKERQGYRPSGNRCKDCVNFRCEEYAGAFGRVYQEKLRCGLGGFKVNMTATCDLWEVKGD